jgi:hypothetical protein
MRVRHETAADLEHRRLTAVMENQHPTGLISEYERAA